jgi:hypothetical protein
VLSVAKQPNLPIEEVFKRIRVSVAQSTEGRQIPWDSSSLIADFKFFGGDGNTQQPSATGAASPALASATRSVEDWRKELQGKEPKVAYELVVSEDSVEAYAAFVEMFQAAPYGPRIRLLLERRRQMIAWANAVAVNTGPSYETFLASYPNSDLAATARKLEERVQNRTIVAPAPLATTVALGPTCPCSTPGLPATPTLLPAKRHVEEEPSPPVKKKVEKSTPKHKQPPEEVVVQRRPPPEQGPPPGAVMEGIGIGLGIGMGMGGGMGGRGGGMEGGHRY